MFLGILQNSQENTSGKIELQALACNFIKKETLPRMFSQEFCKISKNTFSYATPSAATSALLLLLTRITLFITLLLDTLNT